MTENTQTNISVNTTEGKKEDAKKLKSMNSKANELSSSLAFGLRPSRTRRGPNTKAELASVTLKSMIDLIKYPVLTEKTETILVNNRQYTFDVDKRLTKTQIKKLFETLFEVNVIGVNTHIPPRKTVRVGMARGYRPSYKRVIITLQENQTINYNINNLSFEKESKKAEN